MKKNLSLLFILLMNYFFILAQGQGQEKIDSLHAVLKSVKEDTNKVNTLNSLASEFRYNDPDSSIIFSRQALSVSEKIKWKIGIGKSHHSLGMSALLKGDYTVSLQHYSEALEIWDEEERAGQISKSQILALKAKTISNIGIIYKEQGDYPTALQYYFKALKISEELGDKNGIASHYSNIGNVYKHQGDYSNALKYYFKGLDIEREYRYKALEANTLGNLGVVYDEQGDFPKALEYYFKAEKMYEELGSKNDIAVNLGNIGIVYYQQDDYAQALEYYFKALKIAEELGDKKGIAGHLSNIGDVYRDQIDYSNAVKYYFKALDVEEEYGFKEFKANTLGNLGVLFMNQSDSDKSNKDNITGSYLKALGYFHKALEVSEEIGDKNQIATNLGNIGILYNKQNKLSEAEKYLNDALKLAQEIEVWDLMRDLNENLSNLYSKESNFKKAFKHFKNYIAARDSIGSEEKAKRQTRIEMNYEYSKQQDSLKTIQDKKDTFAKASIEKQKLIGKFIAGGSGIILLSSFFSFFFYKRKRDAEQKQKETSLSLQVSETEMKALRSQMNPHFIFNALQSIQTFLMSHKSEEANIYLLKFSKLMRLVLENSQHSEVSLKDDMQALELYMQLESIRLPHPFTYEFHIDESIDLENDTIPPLILQPFVENAIWHGLQYKEQSGHINIYIRKRDNALYATVEDNGVGRNMSKQVQPPMLIKKESLGMKLTEERLKILNELKKIKAEFKITDLFTKDNQPAGTKVELSLPLVA
jgi:tetratricopeptide (TPR) repeat protein